MVFNLSKLMGSTGKPYHKTCPDGEGRRRVMWIGFREKLGLIRNGHAFEGHWLGKWEPPQLQMERVWSRGVVGRREAGEVVVRSGPGEEYWLKCRCRVLGPWFIQGWAHLFSACYIFNRHLLCYQSGLNTERLFLLERWVVLSSSSYLHHGTEKPWIILRNGSIVSTLDIMTCWWYLNFVAMFQPAPWFKPSDHRWLLSMSRTREEPHHTIPVHKYDL